MTAWLLIAPLLWFQADPLEQARKLYQSTQYEKAIQAASALQSPDAALLAAQSWFGLEEYKKATDLLEKTIEKQPGRADLHLWLGRAYGRRAETSNPLMAPRYASRARENFERAVALNPKYVEAMSDLFEYYLQAPGFLGGGKDKAAAMAQKISAIDKAEGYFAQARLAEDRKDYTAAEQQLRQAMDAAPGNVGRVLDLAKFLARRGRIEESEQAFRKAEQIAPASPKILFDRAAVYVEGKRNLDQARALLRRYLAAQLTPDDPSRKEAEKLLKSAG